MRVAGLIFLLSFIIYSVGISYERCYPSFPMEEAIVIAREYTGMVYYAKLSYRKRCDCCVYRIKGIKGVVEVDADSGKVIKFTRYRR